MQPAYVDNTTFASAPTGIDLSQVVPQGSIAANSAELTNVLRRASSYIDNSICFQNLRATTDFENGRIRPNRWGQLQVWTKQFPIIAVLQFQFRPNMIQEWEPPSDVSKIDYTNQHSFILDDKNYTCYRGLQAKPLGVKYCYASGWPHTTLANPATAGAESITVSDPSGIGPAQTTINLTIPGTSTVVSVVTDQMYQDLHIYDGASSEDIVITGVSGGILTLESGLAYGHAEDTLVSCIPEAVQQATILIAAYLIKTRGTGAFMMTDRSLGGRVTNQNQETETGMGEAKAMLQPFKRVMPT